MTSTKKAFVGSLFQFTSIGAEEVIINFRKQFADEADAPFISYNEKTQLFSCDIHPNDESPVSLLNTQIAAYVTNQGKKPNGPLESDRLIPIVGTTFREETHHTRPRELEPNPLFELDDSSEEDVGLDRDTQLYWRPSCGDITILSSDIAAEIADTTGTFFIPDLIGQRVQLAQGNSQLALQKLNRLEKVLTLAAAHQSHVNSRVDANRLLLTTGSESTLRFVRPAQPLCGFDRIILDHEQFPICNQMLLAEVRLWKESQRVKPINLDLEGVSLTASSSFSKVFNAARLQAFGDIRNTEARAFHKETPQFPLGTQHSVSSTKFLDKMETERVEAWRGTVDPDAAPTLPPAEPVPEEAKSLSRRRVVKDSDDESEISDSDNATAEQSQSNDVLQKGNQIPNSTGDRHTTNADPQVAETTQEHQVNTVTVENKSELQPSQASSSQTKSTSRLSNLKGRFQSKNSFELIEDHELAEVVESTSEEPLSDRSNDQTKQLNVTFEEPASITGDAIIASKRSPSWLEKSSNTAFDPGRYTKKGSPSSPRPNAIRQYSSPSHGRNSIPLTSPTRSVQAPTNVGETPSMRPYNLPMRHRQEHKPSGTDVWPRRQPALIDVSAEIPSPEPVKPPPGFYYRSDTPSQSATTQISPPSDSCHHDATHSEVVRNTGSTTSFGTSGSADVQAGELGYTPQYAAPKINMHVLKSRAAAGLLAQIEAENASNNAESGVNGLPPNRIQKNDEYSSRKYRKTMSQKMAKPNKGKNSSKKQETKAEQQARIARAKADAYGDTTPAKIRPPKPIPETQHSAANASKDMSVKKRQLVKKNKAMADLHQDVLTDSAIEDVAAGLLEDLTPILEATRAFKGKIRIEVQLGQALVLKNNRVDESRLYTPKDWMQLLNGKSRNDIKATFTNILTQNGCDIDRMLEIKSENGASKLWSDAPAACHATFEFSCQDKSGRDFVLVLDQEGNHSLNKEPYTIGQVAIHMPSRIWDACATVSGTMKLLRPPQDVLAGVEQFKESIYISGGQEAVIYYRLPPNNAFTIRSIVVKRLSTHSCLLSHQSNAELRITEVKVLTHSSCPNDKKLYRSAESSFEVMVREGRLHYEVAIADRSLEKAFEANPAIEIGELASIATENPDGKILNYFQAHGLVQITTYMLEHLDWMGAQNIGTLRRWFDSAADQRATLVNALGPNMHRNLPMPIGTTAPPTIAPTVYPSQQSRVGGAPTNAGAPEATPRPLPGVRANTAAQLFRDTSTGELYFLGLGGARIPYFNEELEGMKSDGMGPVLPDDSASQAGDLRRRTAGNHQKSKSGIHDDKPASFW